MVYMGMMVCGFSVLLYLIMTAMEKECSVKSNIPLLISLAVLLLGLFCTLFCI